MSSLSSAVGLVDSGDALNSDQINHSFLGVGAEGMTNATYNASGKLAYFESLGRQVTMTYNARGQLTQISCFFVSQSSTVTQTITYNINGTVDTISSPVIT